MTAVVFNLQAAAADDGETAQLKASLEKSRKECEAVSKQLEMLTQNLSQLNAERQLVCFSVTCTSNIFYLFFVVF